MVRLRTVAILSFLFSLAFFFEYTRWSRRVHIPFDLEGYHYPLADYTFRAIRDGRFPQWDAANYSGMTFAGNVQAALFYPPTWIMIAADLRRERLSYQSLQYLDLAHVWLAFLLGYYWLKRAKGLHLLASVLGAGIFAFSGYVLTQLQHFGLVAGYAWLPLGFAAIEEAAKHRSWRPLWKLAVASAMCFLAGYPATWLAFALCVTVYAAARRSPMKAAGLAVAALAVSLLVAAVQLLPTLEATKLKVPELLYGPNAGIRSPGFFLSYFVPNYFDFDIETPVRTNPNRDYLYLGGPALAGLFLLLLRKKVADLGPPLGVLAAALLVAVNPFGWLGSLIQHSTLLAQVINAYYYLAGVTAAIALLAAIGLDYGIRIKHKSWPAWPAVILSAAGLAWAVRLLALWNPGAHRLATGWTSAVDALLATAFCIALLVVFTRVARPYSALAAFTLVALAAAEYKAFGTSKRFNASRYSDQANFGHSPFPAMNRSTYDEMRKHPEYRVALDFPGPLGPELRHNGLATPQGFDPFITTQYKAMIGMDHFRTNRVFAIDPGDMRTLGLLGIRYFVSSGRGEAYPKLAAAPTFKLMLPDDSYYKVFELDQPTPAFGWEDGHPGDSAEASIWQPEFRSIQVKSTSGGVFRLSEQWFPGWIATIDGTAAGISRCETAFQCLTVPPGEHMVQFRYRSRFLLPGAVISFCTIGVGIYLLRRKADFVNPAGQATAATS
jgi:hypothetical protein